MAITVKEHPEIPLGTKIYLASPFNHVNKHERNRRCMIVKHITPILLEAGYKVFSPIAHNQHIAETFRSTGVNFTLENWLEFDFTFLKDWADVLCVLMIDGWDKSEGIKREIEFAKEHDIPTFFLDKHIERGDNGKDQRLLIFQEKPI